MNKNKLSISQLEEKWIESKLYNSESAYVKGGFSELPLPISLWNYTELLQQDDQFTGWLLNQLHDLDTNGWHYLKENFDNEKALTNSVNQNVNATGHALRGTIVGLLQQYPG